MYSNLINIFNTSNYNNTTPIPSNNRVPIHKYIPIKSLPTFKAVFIVDNWFPRSGVLINNCKEALKIPGDQHNFTIFKYSQIDLIDFTIKLKPNRIIEINIDSAIPGQSQKNTHVFPDIYRIKDLLIDMIGNN